MGRLRSVRDRLLAPATGAEPFCSLLHARQDIANGNSKLVLALTWQLMRYHCMVFLAQQVAKELSVVAPKLSLLCVYGGSAMGPQCNALRNGVDLIVGTPGRLKDLNERGALALESVRVVTLDEADMMLDMGFQDDMKAILGTCSHPERQTCLFSATLPKVRVRVRVRVRVG